MPTSSLAVHIKHERSENAEHHSCPKREVKGIWVRGRLSEWGYDRFGRGELIGVNNMLRG